MCSQVYFEIGKAIRECDDRRLEHNSAVYIRSFSTVSPIFSPVGDGMGWKLIQEDLLRLVYSFRCHKAVSMEDGTYYCASCDKQVLEATPQVKIVVFDGEDSATFVVFDTDCQAIFHMNCRDMVAGSKGKNFDVYPETIKGVVGMDLLFKVEKLANHGAKFDDSYKVKKICDMMHLL